jgi:putative FmdB family regulatory protein
MPTYEFNCKQCGNRFEVMVPSSKKAEVRCTSCKSHELQEVYSVNVSKSTPSKGNSCAQSDTCPSRGFG